MKLLDEIIGYALNKNLINDQQLDELKSMGLYASDEDYDYYDDYGYYDYGYYKKVDEHAQREDELYYPEFYDPPKRFGRRHAGRGKRTQFSKEPKTPILLDELLDRIQECANVWKKRFAPVCEMVNLLVKYGMPCPLARIETWQEAVKALETVQPKSVSAVLSELSLPQSEKLLKICSSLSLRQIQRELGSLIVGRSGEAEKAFREIITGIEPEMLSEAGRILATNEPVTDIYVLVRQWQRFW